MTIICINGFEQGAVKLPSQLGDTQQVVTGRDGIGLAARAATSNQSSHHILMQMIAPGSDRIFTTQGVSQDQLTFNHSLKWLWQACADNNTIQHGTVTTDAFGRIQLRRGSATGTILATSVQQLPAVKHWYNLEVKFLCHDTTGEFEVKVNGQVWATFTGDTKNAGVSTRMDCIRLGTDNTSGELIDFDDLVVADTLGSVNNTWLGEVVVRGLKPNGNGATNTLVGSDGNSTDNYLLVDEVPASAADYVGSVTPGAKDFYNHEDVGRVGNVLAVQPLVTTLKSDIGPKGFRPLSRSILGTEVAGADQYLSTTAVLYAGEILEVDPDGNPWTVARVDGAQWGYEVRA